MLLLIIVDCCECRYWMRIMSLATLFCRCRWCYCNTAHHHSAMPVTTNQLTTLFGYLNQWSDIAGSWRCLSYSTRSLTQLFIIYTVPQKNLVLNFCNNFIKCQPILKILLLLEAAINYLQNKYNTSRRLIKTWLHYHGAVCIMYGG